MVRFGHKTILLSMASLWMFPAWGGVTKWRVDKAHSEVSFSVRHMGLAKVKGSFSGMTGEMILDQENVEKSRIEMTIPVANINTNNPKRDGHLLSPDFFHVEKYPTITFKSTKVQQLKPGGRELNICGWLMMHGKKNEECFIGRLNGPQQYPTGKWGMGFETTKPDFVSRKAYGVGTKFPDAAEKSFSDKMLSFATKKAASLIGDQVNFEINVELIRQEDSVKKNK
ncbi:MAG: YceI family protein [Myxococcota bacterium]